MIDHDFAYFDDFANMHVEMVKKFGLASKKEDYDQMLNIFQKKMKLFVSFVDSELITALLCYYTPTTVYATKGPYLPKAGVYLNNILPVCTAIRDACESGYQYFDMGFTHTSSLTAYKEKFGATTCRDLLHCDLTTPEGGKYFSENNLHDKVCVPCVKEAVRIVEKIL